VPQCACVSLSGCVSMCVSVWVCLSVCLCVSVCGTSFSPTLWTCIARLSLKNNNNCTEKSGSWTRHCAGPLTWVISHNFTRILRWKCFSKNSHSRNEDTQGEFKNLLHRKLFFFFPHPQYVEVSGPGMEPTPQQDPRHCSVNTGYLTRWATWELQESPPKKRFSFLFMVAPTACGICPARGWIRAAAAA